MLFRCNYSPEEFKQRNYIWNYCISKVAGQLSRPIVEGYKPLVLHSSLRVGNSVSEWIIRCQQLDMLAMCGVRNVLE